MLVPPSRDTRTRKIGQRTTTFAVAFAAGILCFLATYSGFLKLPSVSIEWPERDLNLQPVETRRGPEVALIYIGSSRCRAASSDDFVQLLGRVMNKLREEAIGANQPFVTVGVALDDNVDAGVRHLSRFASFDELTAGRGWLNNVALRYVWTDFPGTPATPQVLLVERFVENGSMASSRLYDIQGERLIRRFVGIAEIETLLDMKVMGQSPDTSDSESYTSPIGS